MKNYKKFLYPLLISSAFLLVSEGMAMERESNQSRPQMLLTPPACFHTVSEMYEYGKALKKLDDRKELTSLEIIQIAEVNPPINFPNDTSISISDLESYNFNRTYVLSLAYKNIADDINNHDYTKAK